MRQQLQSCNSTDELCIIYTKELFTQIKQKVI